jgi:outer membrane protein assembly factor BamB
MVTGVVGEMNSIWLWFLDWRCEMKARTNWIRNGDIRSLAFRATFASMIGSATDNKNRFAGTKSAPTVDGDRIYTISIDGILNCLSTNGYLLWSTNITTGAQPDFGITGAPLLEGNLVIVNACGHGVAVDKTTHNVVWGDSDNAMHGYATPYAVTIGSQRTVANGKRHWFQAGDEGALVVEFSSACRDEFDVFTDPRIKRML